MPVAELSLLWTNAQTWLGQKALYALLGLSFAPLVVLVVALIGLRLPAAVPVAGSVLLAAAMWFVPDIEIRVKAATRRAEFAAP